MSPLILLSIVLQIACCVHVVRSGRPLYWILILLTFSYLAVLIYAVVAVIPDMRNDPTARRSLQRVRRKLDPQREQRDAARKLDVSDTPENRRQLARTLLSQGNYAQAADVYEGALRGLYRDDP
ncbi:membrane protein, partial [Xanthomonas vesicatoria]